MAPNPPAYHIIPRDAGVSCPHCGYQTTRVRKTWDDEDCSQSERVLVKQRRYCPSCDPDGKREFRTAYWRHRTTIVGIVPSL